MAGSVAAQRRPFINVNGRDQLLRNTLTLLLKFAFQWNLRKTNRIFNI